MVGERAGVGGCGAGVEGTDGVGGEDIGVWVAE